MSANNSAEEGIQKLELDRLVGRRLSELELRPHALVRRWGYANTSKGLRRLGQLRVGQFKPDAQGVRDLAAALEVPCNELRQAIEATRQQLEQARQRAEDQEWTAWCSRFHPHAILKTDQPRPSPIFVAAILGTERILRLDFDHDRPPVTWPSQVAASLPEWVPAFGRVIGFYLNYSPDRAVEFDRVGKAIGEYSVAVRPGRAWMEHKGRDITSALRAATCTRQTI